MRNMKNIALVALATLALVSCKQEDERAGQYFPNMYVSEGYETYQAVYDTEVFENNMQAQLPVEGTISRGLLVYEYEDNEEGYQAAKAGLSNPIPATQGNLAKGEEYYTIYCAVCHGDKGDGKGVLALREKILGVPAYNDAGRAITPGSTYHVVYHGRNSMGSYAAQISEVERWQVTHYVMALKADLDGVDRPALVAGDETLSMDPREMRFRESDTRPQPGYLEEAETLAPGVNVENGAGPLVPVEDQDETED